MPQEPDLDLCATRTVVVAWAASEQLALASLDVHLAYQHAAPGTHSTGLARRWNDPSSTNSNVHLDLVPAPCHGPACLASRACCCLSHVTSRHNIHAAVAASGTPPPLATQQPINNHAIHVRHMLAALKQAWWRDASALHQQPAPSTAWSLSHLSSHLWASQC